MFELDWGKLPNLQLIGERFCFNIFENINKKGGYPEFELLGVFYQTWPNNLGLKNDGELACLDIVSSYYTSVIYERLTDTYGVFQNNELAYLVEGSSEKLIEDIANHSMACLKIAKYRYSNEEE